MGWGFSPLWVNHKEKLCKTPVLLPTYCRKYMLRHLGHAFNFTLPKSANTTDSPGVYVNQKMKPTAQFPRLKKFQVFHTVNSLRF